MALGSLDPRDVSTSVVKSRLYTILPHLITATVTCLTTNLLCFFIAISYWGSNQDITPERIKSLAQGMTAQECAEELGLPRAKFGPFGLRRSITVCSPGIGSFFVPQYRCDLEFETNDRLLDARVEVGYQGGEQPVFVSLGSEISEEM